jgi:hypothetical protein
MRLTPRHRRAVRCRRGGGRRGRWKCLSCALTCSCLWCLRNWLGYAIYCAADLRLPSSAGGRTAMARRQGLRCNALSGHLRFQPLVRAGGGRREGGHRTQAQSPLRWRSCLPRVEQPLAWGGLSASAGLVSASAVQISALQPRVSYTAPRRRGYCRSRAPASKMPVRDCDAGTKKAG